MDIRQVQEYLSPQWGEVQALMKKALASDIPLLNFTNDNLLSNSGKMLRPMLTLLMARACGDCNQDSVRSAASVELLHNATLFHDDVADASDTRRGKPTVNALLGSRASVLLGDFWLVRAVETILSMSRNTNEVVRLFSKTLSDLAEGEMLQLQKASKADTTEEDYLRIIYSKTASLFEVACVTAAMSAGASEEVIEAARSYAVNLGLAFQMKDDIMDYHPKGSIGKPVGIDILEQKITLPLLEALLQAGEQEQEEIRQIVMTVSDHPERASEVISFVKRYNGVVLAGEKLDTYVRKAVDALEPLPQSEARDLLVQLARFTAEREM